MKKIIHIDMDCYFAQVEERDNPKYKYQPIAIGGPANTRSVLSTSNYEARKFGVRSAMTSSKAMRLCPKLIILPGRYALYKKISQEIYEIYTEFTDKIEPLSLDEAYLDVTEYCKDISATRLAEIIRTKIFEKVQLTASAGIAPNKLLAKIASDLNKPNGQFVIKPNEISEFIKPLEVRKLPGVGKTTQKKMEEKNISTCLELQKFSIQDLHLYFGKFGKNLYYYCRGIDDRSVGSQHSRQSLSIETTFQKDLELPALINHLDKLYRDLLERIDRSKFTIKDIKAITCKLKFFDFQTSTLTIEFTEFNIDHYKTLVQSAYNSSLKPARLLGIGVTLKQIKKEDENQLSFNL